MAEEKYQEEDTNLTRVLQQAMESFITSLGFGNIARVTKVNQKTINCKVVINKYVNNQEMEFPEFVEVPLVKLYGGNTSLRMPIAVGDYCYLFINERCFDSWHAGQDFVRPREFRYLDYSDAIALVGIRPDEQDYDIPTTATFQGDLIHNGDLTHTGDTTQTGDVEQTGNSTITGNETITQLLTANQIAFGSATGNTQQGNVRKTNITFDDDSDITIAGVSLRDFIQNHTHGGVQTGSGNTGTPN